MDKPNLFNKLSTSRVAFVSVVPRADATPEALEPSSLAALTFLAMVAAGTWQDKLLVSRVTPGGRVIKHHRCKGITPSP